MLACLPRLDEVRAVPISEKTGGNWRQVELWFGFQGEKREGGLGDARLPHSLESTVKPGGVLSCLRTPWLPEMGLL